MARPVLELSELEHGGRRGAAPLFERDLVVRVEPAWVGLRVTTRIVGPPRSQAILLSHEQAGELEQFLRNQRLAREAGEMDT